MAEMREPRLLRTITVLFLTILLCATAAARIIYVDDDAPDLGDALSWETAYRYLQDALAEAEAAGEPVEIRVARGLYRPDRSAAHPEGTGDREATFFLVDRTTIKGGYAGLATTDPNERDIEAYATVLSGDLAGNDVLSEDPCDFVRAPDEGNWTRPEQWCLLIESTRVENSLHVVTFTGEGQSATLDGFTITAGNAFYPPYWEARDTPIHSKDEDEGGGVFHEGGSLTLQACTFVSNSSKGAGGAVLSRASERLSVEGCSLLENYGYRGPGALAARSVSELVMTGSVVEDNTSWGSYGATILASCAFVLRDCRFTNNDSLVGLSALGVSGGGGELDYCAFTNNHGAVYIEQRAAVKLSNCGFAANRAAYGAAVNSWRGIVEIRRCSFAGNRARRKGGAIQNSLGAMTIENSLLAGNSAVEEGGALHVSGDTTVRNSTIVDNRALHRGGAISVYYGTALSVANSILWRNASRQGPDLSLTQFTDGLHPSSATVAFSLLEFGPSGVSLESNCVLNWDAGNIQTDPLFAGPGYWDSSGTLDDPNDGFWVDGDYHLRSQAGRWDPATDNWVTDDITSPCIDAGDPNSPIGHEPFPNGGRINMGAYGGTAAASKSYFNGPVCETVIAGDVNGDCCVDFMDFQILSLHWLQDRRAAPSESGRAEK